MSLFLWFKARVDIRIILKMSNIDTKTQDWRGDVAAAEMHIRQGWSASKSAGRSGPEVPVWIRTHQMQSYKKKRWESQQARV